MSIKRSIKVPVGIGSEVVGNDQDMKEEGSVDTAAGANSKVKVDVVGVITSEQLAGEACSM